MPSCTWPVKASPRIAGLQPSKNEFATAASRHHTALPNACRLERQNRPCSSSASAVGYYGDRGDELLDESSPPGHGFLADVCQQWEAATKPARDADIRVVNLRIGVVHEPKGGALASMLTPFRARHRRRHGQRPTILQLDHARRSGARDHRSRSMRPHSAGPVNAVAPEPVTNREFTKTLGRVLGRPTVFPMPAFAARLALRRNGRRNVPQRQPRRTRALSRPPASRSQHPQLEPALRHVLAT